jgi:Protein of unknown function (DUF3048) N-terminal domain/Protein of unknown function (DUF3048) C-terminal domain
MWPHVSRVILRRSRDVAPGVGDVLDGDTRSRLRAGSALPVPLGHSEYVRTRPTVGIALLVVLLGVGSVTMPAAARTRPPAPAADTPGPESLFDPLRVAPTKTPTPAGSPVSMDRRAPLTGFPADRSTLTHPAVTIKVSNESRAHPQRGLNQADIVFAERITTATTRFAAIFHSLLPAEVGPVRSLRPSDAALIGPTGGVLGNTMAADWVLAYVHETANLDDFGTITVKGSDAYRIDNRRRAPNHVFASPAALLSLSRRTAPPPPYFLYAPDAASSTAAKHGTPAERIDIPYGGPASASWVYDADSGRWLRFEARGPHVLHDDTQVSATNVLVLHAQPDAAFPKAGDTMEVLDFVNASGALQLFASGRTVSGRWTKRGVNDPFFFTDARGRPLLLTPGNTWIECVAETVAVAASPTPTVAPAVSISR